MSKRNVRAWDADDEPHKIDQLPPTPRKRFKRLSREIMDRAESNRANGAAVPFYELEDWSDEVTAMEVTLRQVVYGAKAMKCHNLARLAQLALRRPNGKAKR